MKGVSRAGAFVVLAHGLEARVKLGNLADGFVANPEQAFPEGKLVTGRVVSVDSGRWGAWVPPPCVHDPVRNGVGVPLRQCTLWCLGLGTAGRGVACLSVLLHRACTDARAQDLHGLRGRPGC